MSRLECAAAQMSAHEPAQWRVIDLRGERHFRPVYGSVTPYFSALCNRTANFYFFVAIHFRNVFCFDRGLAAMRRSRRLIGVCALAISMRFNFKPFYAIWRDNDNELQNVNSLNEMCASQTGEDSAAGVFCMLIGVSMSIVYWVYLLTDLKLVFHKYVCLCLCVCVFDRACFVRVQTWSLYLINNFRYMRLSIDYGLCWLQ